MLRQQGPTKLFLFSYASAACVILILAIAAFALTQLSLVQESDALRSEGKYRALAITATTGMLRNQRLLRSTIILIAHPPAVQATEALQNILTDYPIWEHVHDTIVHGDSRLGIVPSDFSTSEQAKMKSEESDYQAIHSALAHILTFEQSNGGKHASTKPIFADVSTVFYATPRYGSALYSVYTSLNSNADTYSASVTNAVDREHILSIIVLITTIITLILEAALIIIPANKQMESMFATLALANNKITDTRTALR